MSATTDPVDQELKACQEVEEKFFTEVEKSGPWSGASMTLKNELASIFEKFILSHLEEAHAASLDSRLWTCFHIPIDSWRKQPRSPKGRQSISSTQAMGKTSPKSAPVVPIEAFFDSVEVFYVSLIKKLQTVHRVDFHFKLPITPPLLESVSPSKNPNHELCTRSVHQYLLALGDVARYRSTCGNNELACLKRAAKHYKLAIRLCPAYGAPHNQLGVIAGKKKMELNALYHYWRGYLACDPFLASKQNILLSLKKVPAATKGVPTFQCGYTGETLFQNAINYVVYMHTLVVLPHDRKFDSISLLNDLRASINAAFGKTNWSTLEAASMKQKLSLARKILFFLIFSSKAFSWEAPTLSTQQLLYGSVKAFVSAVMDCLSSIGFSGTSNFDCDRLLMCPLLSIVHLLAIWCFCTVEPLKKESKTNSELSDLWNILVEFVEHVNPHRYTAIVVSRPPLKEERMLHGFGPTANWINSLPLLWQEPTLAEGTNITKDARLKAITCILHAAAKAWPERSPFAESVYVAHDITESTTSASHAIPSDATDIEATSSIMDFLQDADIDNDTDPSQSATSSSIPTVIKDICDAVSHAELVVQKHDHVVVNSEEDTSASQHSEPAAVAPSSKLANKHPALTPMLSPSQTKSSASQDMLKTPQSSRSPITTSTPTGETKSSKKKKKSKKGKKSASSQTIATTTTGQQEQHLPAKRAPQPTPTTSTAVTSKGHVVEISKKQRTTTPLTHSVPHQKQQQDQHQKQLHSSQSQPLIHEETPVQVNAEQNQKSHSQQSEDTLPDTPADTTTTTASTKSAESVPTSSTAAEPNALPQVQPLHPQPISPPLQQPPLQLQLQPQQQQQKPQQQPSTDSHTETEQVGVQAPVQWPLHPALPKTTPTPLPALLPANTATSNTTATTSTTTTTTSPRPPQQQQQQQKQPTAAPTAESPHVSDHNTSTHSRNYQSQHQAVVVLGHSAAAQQHPHTVTISAETGANTTSSTTCTCSGVVPPPSKCMCWCPTPFQIPPAHTHSRYNNPRATTITNPFVRGQPLFLAVKVPLHVTE
ncbi:protein SMG7 [Pelomyxa schiedti]|nr:protein SMG7 [Pelomyxa schiedti]